MSNLEVVDLETELPLVRNLGKSLAKNFKLTSEEQIDNAVTLANYLYALEKTNSSILLLESFIGDITYDNTREDIWGAVGQGIILRAHIAIQAGEKDLCNKLISRIKENDIMEVSEGFYDLYLECLEDHEGSFQYARTETPKYRCQIVSQECLTFLYFLEMMPFHGRSAPKDLAADLKRIVSSCYSELKKALKEQ